jgi:WS/DGAT/MGAT family acyltransferase
VVVALCAGALRRWLLDHDALPEQPLVVAVPVSVRTDAQQGTLGNRVSMMIAPLPTNVADPGTRLKLVHEAMRAAKEQHGALPASLLADVTQFAMPARLVERINPFNLIISNVPGPNVPLYFAGAELIAYYPLSAITDGQGLNITVLSYLGGLNYGLIAGRELMPDLDTLGQYLGAELDTLSRLVAPAPAAPKPRSPRTARRGGTTGG